MVRKAGFETFTHIGFAARGLMYLIIGYLALRTGRGEDPRGALDYLSSEAGRLLLGFMAVGFLGYAIWRIAEAFIDSEGHGNDAKGLVVRTGGVASGLIHIALCLYAARLALNGGNGNGGSGDTVQKGAADALTLPGGQMILILASAAIIGTGLYQLVKAYRSTFLRYLDPQATRREWVRWLGRGGYAARGLVFLAMGLFLFLAATGDDPGKAADMGSTIESMPDALRTATAAGLVLFGLFSLVEAIYRRINDPHVLERMKAAAR